MAVAIAISAGRSERAAGWLVTAVRLATRLQGRLGLGLVALRCPRVGYRSNLV